MRMQLLVLEPLVGFYGVVSSGHIKRPGPLDRLEDADAACMGLDALTKANRGDS
jgi:hypothetical protein